jgi:hypothetical protein
MAQGGQVCGPEGGMNFAQETALGMSSVDALPNPPGRAVALRGDGFRILAVDPRFENEAAWREPATSKVRLGLGGRPNPGRESDRG